MAENIYVSGGDPEERADRISMQSVELVFGEVAQDSSDQESDHHSNHKADDEVEEALGASGTEIGDLEIKINLLGGEDEEEKDTPL